MNLDGVVVWIGSIVLITLVPILIVFTVSSILALPVLVEAEKYRKTEVTADDW